MTQFISHAHDDFRKARLTRRGSTHKPDDVPVGLHKVYERMEKIFLPQPSALETTLPEVLDKRTSYSEGSEEGHISPESWGTLLGLALKKRKDSVSRNYPSGGALYPIETYLVANIDESVHAVFHYNPTEHVLEKLWNVPPEIKIKSIVPQPPDLLFSAIIAFTSVWRRSSAKYGDFTYTPALLEAGHMSENILLTATALKLKSRPMAGFKDDMIIPLLDLDANYEQPVHTIILSA